MLRTQSRLVATFFALSLIGWFGCKDDDSSGDGGSGSDDGGTGDDGSDDGGEDGSDDGGTGTGTGSSGTGTGSSGTGTGSSGTGTGSSGTGTGTGSSGTGTGSSGTGSGTGSSGTGTGSSGSGTGSVACEDIDNPPECMGTEGCDWEGGGGAGECVPFDGDCSEFSQQHCEMMVECTWDEGDCVDA